MATTAVSLQPVKPAASTSPEHSATATGTDTATPTGPTSQPLIPSSTKQKGEAHGFGILQHTGPPVQDDILGLYRDGRVRNPVPSKLKGKTDARKGNFGVMHIDLSTTNETQERDAAAKRTSEGTQLAAKLAQTDRYVPIKRSKFVYRPEDQAAPIPQRPGGVRQRTSPLTVAETKAEQARLLALLRSLQPVLVVDQLCKALTFFGEISGAQPSADGVFPDSAEANGSGSLFVGWLAEIFPALGHGSIPNAQQPRLKRPRGRPKGSKNAKGKDKLARKRFGPTTTAANATGEGCASSGLVMEPAVDDSWVDVDDDAADNEGEALGQLERNLTSPSRNYNQVVVGPVPSGSALSSASTKVTAVTSTPKRRGRPKGSKNRPKHKIMLDGATQQAQDASSAAADSAALSIPSNAPTGPVEPGMPGVRKRKPGPGRPKGSKNRPKEAVPPSEQDTQSTQALSNIGLQGEASLSDALQGASQSSSVIAIMPPVQTEQQQQQQQQNTVTAIPPPPVSEQAREAVTAKSNVGENPKGTKRKRKAAQEGSTTKPDDSSTVGPASTQSPVDAVAVVTSHSGSSPQLTRYHDSPNHSSTHAYQPSKRQRLSTELLQERALNSHVGQAIQPEAHTSQPDASAGHYDVNLGGADGCNLQRSRQQMSTSANRSTLRQTPNNRQTEPDPPMGFSRNMVTPAGTGQHVERLKAVSSYTMNMPGRTAQGIHNQVRPTQSHQPQHQHQRQHQQQQQQQQSQRHQQKSQQQLSPSHNRPNAIQHHLSNPDVGQMRSTAGQDASPFTASTSEGGYHGLTSVQQPSFNAQLSGPATGEDANYRSSTSRSMQHHSQAFQTRQAHGSQNPGLSSFQDYSGSSFLEMAGLDSSSQASLNMNSPSYGISGGNMQRASPNISPSYGSASNMGQPSFDGSITESALRERMYHTLRRQ